VGQARHWHHNCFVKDRAGPGDMQAWLAGGMDVFNFDCGGFSPPFHAVTAAALSIRTSEK